MKDDWENDPSWQRFRGHVMAEMLPKLLDSSLMVSLCPTDVGDAKYWVELGASIMHDKPIIVVAAPGRKIPERLLRVADKVIRADLSSEEGMRDLSEAIALLVADD
jgi:hypothetical protein